MTWRYSYIHHWYIQTAGVVYSSALRIVVLRCNNGMGGPPTGSAYAGVMDPLDEDARLMVRYRDGDLGAFSTLYARHKGPLYRYLLRHVRNAAAAADLFQDVWSRLIATRGRYEARAKFATYLFRIAHNCTVDFFRRNRVMRLQKKLVTARQKHRIGQQFRIVVDGPASDHELVLRGRLETQAPDIDATVYLTECDPSAYSPGDFVNVEVVGARHYDLMVRPIA